MARNLRTRQERLSVAVIGEGITEWHYFNDLKQTEDSGFNLKPSLPKHSNYESICSKALDLVCEGYDFVFCVIDVDYIKADSSIESSYLLLKNQIQKKHDNVLFFESMPCIEIWFLLHYKRTTRIFRNFREIKHEIETVLPKYSKTEKYHNKINIYQVLKSNDKLTFALSNSEWLLKEKNANQNPLHPYSEMHILMDRLK